MLEEQRTQSCSCSFLPSSLTFYTGTRGSRFCFVFPDRTQLMCCNLIILSRTLSFTHLTFSFRQQHAIYFPPSVCLTCSFSLFITHLLPLPSLYRPLSVLLFLFLYILRAYPPVSDKKVIRVLMASISFPLLSWQSSVYCIPEDSLCCF